jgi:Zn-dependent protease
VHASGLDLVIAIFEFVILLFSLSVHECAHAWTALRLGDQTAFQQGRVTLNPIRHIDLLGTLVFPALMIFGPLIGLGVGGFLVGWAKPTPVLTRNFRNIRRDDMLTTLAGPLSNLLLVVLAVLLLAAIALFGSEGRIAVVAAMNMQVLLEGASNLQALAMIAYLAIEVNLALLFFNLMPIPPLDGGHLLRNVLPYKAVAAYDQLARFGFFLVLFLGGFWIRIFLDPSNRIIESAMALFLHLA